ncbi:MAG: glycosyltransferase family 39 protein, partial [Caldilineaceae bacterium]|nr:glycosyltransferase family 39 protein [Caldilineaceae bacterium]
AIFALGRRAWNARVGLLAAAGLTLLPEAIIWSGRARFYSQLQFFTLLTAWAAFAAITTDPRDVKQTRRRLWAFAALFVLALFSQEETLLLYPSLLLAMLLWWGWRRLLRPDVLAVHGVLLAAMAARYAIELWGQPGYFETIQATRPYVGLVFDVAGAWRTYAPLFIASARLPWTVLGLVGVGAALVTWARQRGRVNALVRFHQATLFFALQLVAVILTIFLLVGTSWREARYLYFVQPFWLLLGAAGAVWLLDRLITGVRWRWLATAALLLGVAVSMWPGARATLAAQVEGYDRVLAYVAANRGEDDVILSPQPPACALVLGPCDGYAIQRGYEEFVIPKEGVLVDRWSGAPLLNTTAQLDAAIDAAPAVWFITDSFRLATRYDADFVRTLVEQFDVAFSERGVLALHAQGRRAQPPQPVTETFATPQPFGPLALVGYARGDAVPGQELPVTLLWTSTAPVSTQYNTSLRLIGPDGSVVAQQDGPPARGIIPTTLIFDQPVPDVKALALPADLAPGVYRLELVAYDVATVTPLTPPQTIGTLTLP